MRDPASLSAAPGWALRLCVAVAALTLGACGFHLRGSSSLPAEMSVTYIRGISAYGPLNDDFREALESHGARVTPDRTEATAVLDILKNDTGTDVLSVNLAGKVLEYRIYQNIQFEVITAAGKKLVDTQSVSLSRAIKFNVNDVLGVERQGDMMRRELQRDIVNLAMLRISAAGRH